MGVGRVHTWRAGFKKRGDQEEDKWQWKLDQLALSTALQGVRRWGRERKTCNGYAQDADEQGQTRWGGALRQRCRTHEQCENLALGGFKVRPYDELVAELNDLEEVVDGWPVFAQKKI